MKTPENAANILETIKSGKNKSVIFTPDKALDLLLSLKVSKWPYITLRESSIREGLPNMYPSYYKVQQAKAACYPSQQGFTITETIAKINLQSLLDITVKRILKIVSNQPIQQQSLTLLSKWGFDQGIDQLIKSKSL